MNGPIFVAGPARSGKTLVRWMLSSHSRIVVTRRTEMWPRFFGRFGDLARPENLDRCLAAMLDRAQIAELSPDVDAVRRAFALGEPTYARLFALVHERYAERCGKPRWGDQSPSIERFADQVLASYEDARFVHLIRDPRDCYAAARERGIHGPGAVGPFTAAWLRSASLAEGNAARYPDAYRAIRYEDLVEDPEETTRELCAFLGEAFDPGMLRMDGVERYRAERAASGNGSPISAAFVGRYRTAVARPDLAFIQAAAEAEMHRAGYALDPVRLTPGERARRAAVWPLGLARTGARRTADALHRRREPATSTRSSHR